MIELQKMEVVEYKTALSFYKIGFNDACLFYYDSNRDLKVVEQVQNDIYEMRFFVNSGTNTKTIAAPTFSQILNWLRETYGIHATLPSPVINCDNKVVYNNYIFIEDHFGMFPIIEAVKPNLSKINHKNYEDAKEALLKTILKYIKESL